jgi:hypothetical protein
MTTPIRSVLSVVVSVSVAGGALAQGPARTPAPAGATAVAPIPVRPSPQVDTFFKWWEGDWKCDITFTAAALGPGKAEATAKASLKVRKEPNGFWYRGEYEREGTHVIAPIWALFVVGYDTVAKAPLGVRYDSWGSVVFETAAGATPEKQAFAGEAHMAGMTAKFRDTMTLKAPNEMEHTFAMDRGKGFQLMFTDLCKK